MISTTDKEKADKLFAILRAEIRPLVEKYFGHVSVTKKGEGANDIFTQADVALQEVLIQRIQEHFPGEGIVAEELKTSLPTTNGMTWYIDPLDGTRNFATGVPIFGVLVARASNTDVLSAMNYLPIFDQLYVAHVGHGATKNGETISASECSDFATSYGLGPVKQGGKKGAQFSEALTSVAPVGVWVNSFGCVAYSTALVSDGRREWWCSRGGNSWDYTAPSLIGKEAGCLVLNYQGEPWKVGDLSIAISAPGLGADIKKMLGGLQEGTI